MRVAIEGCSHGELDRIYSSIHAIDRQEGKITDLLILCGDVQTLRNRADLDCLAVPAKYKQMGDFHRYYNGQRRAPILTVMIGGNHEASNYLWEVYHGGWVAPNIYYLGAAGCLDIGGLVIAGASGIFKSHDYKLGRFERLPYDPSTIRSVYHTRMYDIFRLKLLSGNGNVKRPDIVVSHDWPNSIEQYGDVRWLMKRKPFFKDEINRSELGSPPLMELLKTLKPALWFSAHLHVRFAALLKHSGEPTRFKNVGAMGSTGSSQSEQKKFAPNSEEIYIDESAETGSDGISLSRPNEEEIVIDVDDDGGQPQRGADVADEDPPHHHHHETKDLTELGTHVGSDSTRFLALSKCLEGQDFLQILDVEAPYDTDELYRNKVKTAEDGEEDTASLPIQPTIRFHPRWLAIIRATHPSFSLEKRQATLPPIDDSLESLINSEESWIRDTIAKSVQDTCSATDGIDPHPFAIRRTQNFERTAPPSNDPAGSLNGPPSWYTNPQTESLCSLIQIPMRINPPPSAPPPAHVERQFIAPDQDANLPSRPATSSLPPPSHPAVLSEEEEIRRIEEAAQQAMARKKVRDEGAQSIATKQRERSSEVLTLSDDESITRWKEGTG